MSGRYARCAISSARGVILGARGVPHPRARYLLFGHFERHNTRVTQQLTTPQRPRTDLLMPIEWSKSPYNPFSVHRTRHRLGAWELHHWSVSNGESTVSMSRFALPPRWLFSGDAGVIWAALPTPKGYRLIDRILNIPCGLVSRQGSVVAKSVPWPNRYPSFRMPAARDDTPQAIDVDSAGHRLIEQTPPIPAQHQVCVSHQMTFRNDYTVSQTSREYINSGSKPSR